MQELNKIKAFISKLNVTSKAGPKKVRPDRSNDSKTDIVVPSEALVSREEPKAIATPKASLKNL